MDTEPRCQLLEARASNPQSFNLVALRMLAHLAARVRLIDPRIPRGRAINPRLAGAEKAPRLVYSFAILAFDFHRLDKLALTTSPHCNLTKIYKIDTKILRVCKVTHRSLQN
jgi:hypothetical protein